MELKPCPFCKSEAYLGKRLWRSFVPGKLVYSVRCSNWKCFLSNFILWRAKKEDVVTLWNTRFNKQKRIICKIHNFDWERMRGCPECLAELRKANKEALDKIKEIRILLKNYDAGYSQINLGKLFIKVDELKLILGNN